MKIRNLNNLYKIGKINIKYYKFSVMNYKKNW